MPRAKARPVSETNPVNPQDLLTLLDEWRDKVAEFQEYNERMVAEVTRLTFKAEVSSPSSSAGSNKARARAGTAGMEQAAFIPLGETVSAAPGASMARASAQSSVEDQNN